MSRFVVTDLAIPGVKLVERKVIGDSRGFLTRLFCTEELAAAGWVRPIAQINHTQTAARGSVRGLHFQHPPYAEMKLVTCTRGEVWDVAVDIRTGSETFLQWHGEYLSHENRRALLIPEGCAHGFQAITDEAELVYCHSAPYMATAEAGLHPEDPRLAIRWPLEIFDMSDRDANCPPLCAEFAGVSL